MPFPQTADTGAHDKTILIAVPAHHFATPPNTASFHLLNHILMQTLLHLYARLLRFATFRGCTDWPAYHDRFPDFAYQIATGSRT